jgi:hypothetical protein
MHATCGKPDLSALRVDIEAGNSRTAQAAVEALSESFQGADNTDVPDGYVGGMRSEQAGLRKSLSRIYHLQREEFLPSAYWLIVTIVALILILLWPRTAAGFPRALLVCVGGQKRLAKRCAR